MGIRTVLIVHSFDLNGPAAFVCVQFGPPPSLPFVSANRNDHLQTIPGLKDIQARFSDLDMGEIVGDAGEGFDDILRFIHDDLKALRTMVPRRHTEDENPLTCLKRGYDAQDHPLCLHGYRPYFNGHDYQRRDSKWVCLHRSQPDVVPDPLPSPEMRSLSTCPYRDPEHPLGCVITVNLSFPNGDIRLARDLKVDSATWTPLACASGDRAMLKLATPTNPVGASNALPGMANPTVPRLPSWLTS